MYNAQFQLPTATLSTVASGYMFVSHNLSTFWLFQWSLLRSIEISLIQKSMQSFEYFPVNIFIYFLFDFTDIDESPSAYDNFSAMVLLSWLMVYLVYYLFECKNIRIYSATDIRAFFLKWMSNRNCLAEKGNIFYLTHEWHDCSNDILSAQCDL